MIVEIWRKTVGGFLPNRFTVGESPVEDSPPVKNINFYETGAFKQHWGPCFVIQFENSPMRRVIPTETVVDILYSVPEKTDKEETPALET